MQVPMHDTGGPAAPADQASREREEALALGVGFNGRQFRYREFKYDKLADAMAYARLDRARDGTVPVSPVEPEWLPRPVPSDADQMLIERFAITADGNAFRYRTHRYDFLADALTYAQRTQT